MRTLHERWTLGERWALRRRWARSVLGIAAGVLAAAEILGFGGNEVAAAATPSYAPVTANQPLVFPADYGSHPQFRTEWWYVTGWLTTEHGEIGRASCRERVLRLV